MNLGGRLNVRVLREGENRALEPGSICPGHGDTIPVSADPPEEHTFVVEDIDLVGIGEAVVELGIRREEDGGRREGLGLAHLQDVNVTFGAER